MITFTDKQREIALFIIQHPGATAYRVAVELESTHATVVKVFKKLNIYSPKHRKLKGKG